MASFQLKLAILVLSTTAVSCNQDGESYLHDSNRVHNAEHIREHMKEYMPEANEVKLDDAEAMEFHYFKLHDYDNNDKLDGLELAAAMTHYHDNDDGGEETLRNIDIGDDELSNLVDSILTDDDLNNDGYIDYYEFVQAQRRNRGDTTV